MDWYALFMFIWFLFGLTSAYMAHVRNRNEVLGFIGGYIFGFLAIIYYAMAGKYHAD